MWKIILGGGAAILLLERLLQWPENSINKEKRLFISFSMKDKKYRDHLVGQKKNKRSPFYFIDMSVKKAWKQAVWKEKCRRKIKSCDGVIVLVSDNLSHSKGAKWEIRCAKEEKIPLIGIQIKKNRPAKIPKELKGYKIITWTWENLKNEIDKM